MKKATMCTKSVERRAVQLTIKCQVEAFELLMNCVEPGKRRLRSKGVSSKLAPRAVWVLEVCPNGDVEQRRGNLSVFLHLTGPAKNKKEYIEASYHLYLIGRSGCTTNETIARNIQNFGEEPFNCGSYISHERVKQALQGDGSMMVAADICFLAPNDDEDGGVKTTCEACILSGNKAQERSSVKSYSELHSDNTCSDWVIEVEKRSIGKVLNAGNVVAMAVHADSNSLHMFHTCSAKSLKEACLELIVREWDAVNESAEWKKLQEDMPELAADLALAADLTRTLAEK